MFDERHLLRSALDQVRATGAIPPPFIDGRVLVIDHREHADGERTRCGVAPILFFTRDRRRKPRRDQPAICGACQRILYWMYVCHGRIEAVPGAWTWSDIKRWARCAERRL